MTGIGVMAIGRMLRDPEPDGEPSRSGSDTVALRVTERLARAHLWDR